MIVVTPASPTSARPVRAGNGTSDRAGDADSWLVRLWYWRAWDDPAIWAAVGWLVSVWLIALLIALAVYWVPLVAWRAGVGP